MDAGIYLGVTAAILGMIWLAGTIFLVWRVFIRGDRL